MLFQSEKEIADGFDKYSINLSASIILGFAPAHRPTRHFDKLNEAHAQQTFAEATCKFSKSRDVGPMFYLKEKNGLRPTLPSKMPMATLLQLGKCPLSNLFVARVLQIPHRL